MNVIPGQNEYYNEPHGNWAALFMNVNTDIMNDQWGMSPWRWQTEVGNVLIIRLDGKELTCQQGETVGQHAEFHLQMKWEAPRVRGTEGAENALKVRRHIHEHHLNMEAFFEWFREYRILKIDGGESSWAGFLSPYDV
ncbi:hypothetical protein BGZ57DRAFT_954786 [Hyaloscypha finlandica]|nr:hypothetical protein BGZ57DRAFT_954786 [Hyaloscypha finlandica]